MSFGRADALTVVAVGGALSDALATAGCNRVKRPEDIEPVLEWLCSIPGVVHAVAILGDRLGTKGELELRPVSSAS